jgi:TPR repeat protein
MFYYVKCLQDRKGVEQDVPQAVRLYELVANHGKVIGYFTLWRIYTNGLGRFPIDCSVSVELFLGAWAFAFDTISRFSNGIFRDIPRNSIITKN